MVIIHAYTIRFPTPHRTAESLLLAPTPIMEPAIAWVVLTGIPNNAIEVKVAPPCVVFAQNPWYGFRSVKRKAIVFIILHPPKNVPRDVARIVTGIGIAKDLQCNSPPAINNAVITPIVFWPSFDPSLREKNVDEAICNFPNTLFTLEWLVLGKKLHHQANAITNPAIGETTIKVNVF